MRSLYKTLANGEPPSACDAGGRISTDNIESGHPHVTFATHF